MSKTTIMHIDMDAYFASIEQSLNPMLQGRPIVVCGETDDKENWTRTVVVTCSYEARKFGIKTGMSVPQAKKLCKKIEIISGNHTKYIAASLKIHKILLHYTDLVEPYSIDECFINVSGLKKEPLTIALEIKEALKKKVGITCSVGIAPNKLIAKMSSDLNKPNGLNIIDFDNFNRTFGNMPVSVLWGIGKKTEAKLKSIGINSVKKLGNANESLLRNYFGVLGYKLKEMGLGIDKSIVRSYYDKHTAKSVGHSLTLPKDTSNIDTVKSYILMLCNKVSDRLIKNKLMGKTFTFSIRFHDFTFNMKQISSNEFTNNRWNIYHNSMKLFETFMPLKKKVRLIGVSVSNVTQSYNQLDMLEDSKKHEKLNKLVYNINDEYGDFFIKPASLLIAEKHDD